jgi:predicted Zn-dependent protease
MRWNKDDVLGKLDEAGRMFSTNSFHLFLRIERTGITRFANNEITDNQFYADALLTIRAYVGNRVGVATVNQLDSDSIRQGIQRAEDIARRSPEDPEFTGPPDTKAYPVADGYDDASARTTPVQRADLTSSFVKVCEDRKLTAAGYLQNTEETVATHSSAGLPGYHRGTSARFSMTARTPNATGSGWVLRWANALSDLDIPSLAQVAMDKAEASHNPVELSPGRYTVVLEPVACEYLLWNLTHHFNARGAEEGRSFLARFDDTGQPAGTQVGETLFSPLMTLRREIANAGMQTHPFDEEGSALHDLSLVNSGVVESLSYDQYWARQKGTSPTGALNGIIMEGSGRTTADLVKDVDNGILVTRLWYIRNVDWMKSSVTGMTRDGTFRIEGGEIAEPVKNFRFNEELRRIFRDITATGAPQRFWDFLSPAIVVPEFNFTSTTESI